MATFKSYVKLLEGKGFTKIYQNIPNSLDEMGVSPDAVDPLHSWARCTTGPTKAANMPSPRGLALHNKWRRKDPTQITEKLKKTWHIS